jgi:toxin-antitoxin system PIN domain toxin
MKSYFPDINIWLALVYQGHEHHSIAGRWLDEVEEAEVCFSRFTQLGFLRLLTHSSIMRSDVKNLREAWSVYDSILKDSRIIFANEPPTGDLDRLLRKFSSSGEVSPKKWTDAYLAAFAHASGMELITFDRSLAQISHPSTLLG